MKQGCRVATLFADMWVRVTLDRFFPIHINRSYFFSSWIFTSVE